MAGGLSIPVSLVEAGKTTAFSPPMERSSTTGPACVLGANAGDHAAIHQLLTHVFQAPSRDRFQCSLEDPMYEPSDRLLIRSGGRLVAHVQVAPREMQFGEERFAVASLNWLATLPEVRSQGHARMLMDAAERKMAEDGALLGVLLTRIPHFFRARGWAVCGRHSHSHAGTRDVLAEMSRQAALLKSRPLTIRPWRQVELPSLMRIYERNTSAAIGSWHRSEDYWRWLISSNAAAQVWVALEGPERLELDPARSPIVGYSITRDDQVLELMGDPGHPTARMLLLARACSDAIERDCHAVTIHAPPYDPIHEVAKGGGGLHVHHESDQQGLVFMVKLLKPLELLRRLRPVLRLRANAASALAMPCELGLLVDKDKYHLRLTRRGIQISRNKTGRSYLILNVAEFTRLLLGHLDLEQAISQGRIEASTRVAVDAATALFPRLPLWRSPLDDGIA